MYTSRYERGSETFKMIGKQYYNQIINSEDVNHIREILESYGGYFIKDSFSCGADIFVLGYIMGKRAERAKRKRG